MMQSLSQHSQQLIKQRNLQDSSFDQENEFSINGGGGVQVAEDEKFRLSVAPVAKSLSNLLKDLEDSLYSIKSASTIRPCMVFPDVTKLGLRYTFFEGIGFIEYGQFKRPEASPVSRGSSLFTEVRSDKSLLNQSVEQDYSSSVLYGLGIQCELKLQYVKDTYLRESEKRLSLKPFEATEEAEGLETRDNSKCLR